MVELLDNRQLVKELRLLERRGGSSGKDSIEYPKSIGGGVPHDDLANVTCGVIVQGHGKKPTPGFFFVGRPLRESYNKRFDSGKDIRRRRD